MVALHVHLKGLESFRVSNGKVTLHAAVSSQEKSKVRVWQDGKEDAPLDEQRRFWLDIRRVGSSDAEHSAYFEVLLPGAVFADNPRSITLSWIDFYRN